MPDPTPDRCRTCRRLLPDQVPDGTSFHDPDVCNPVNAPRCWQTLIPAGDLQARDRIALRAAHVVQLIEATVARQVRTDDGRVRVTIKADVVVDRADLVEVLTRPEPVTPWPGRCPGCGAPSFLAHRHPSGLCRSCRPADHEEARP